MPAPEPTFFTTTSGEVIEVPVRGKHYVQPRGYAAPPGSGPAGETCGSCGHLFRNRLARTYLKCRMAEHKWTGGRGSDVLANAPACRLWITGDQNDART